MGQYGDAADAFAGAAGAAEDARVDSTAGGNALFAALPEEVSTRAHAEQDCWHAEASCAASVPCAVSRI